MRLAKEKKGGKTRLFLFGAGGEAKPSSEATRDARVLPLRNVIYRRRNVFGIKFPFLSYFFFLSLYHLIDIFLHCSGRGGEGRGAKTTARRDVDIRRKYGRTDGRQTSTAASGASDSDCTRQRSPRKIGEPDQGRPLTLIEFRQAR